jgi:hypothetical protein
MHGDVTATPTQLAAPANQGSVKLEVTLPPDMANLVAKGGQIMVENVGGQTQLHVVCKTVSGAEQRLSVDLASLTQQAAREHLEKQTEAAASESMDTMSDADMIKALAGCAAEKATSSSPSSSSTSVPNMCDEEAARSAGHCMTDEEIALALAGCVGSGHDDHHGDHVSVEADKMFADDVPWYASTDHHEEYDMSMSNLMLPGFEVE